MAAIRENDWPHITLVQPRRMCEMASLMKRGKYITPGTGSGKSKKQSVCRPAPTRSPRRSCGGSSRASRRARHRRSPARPQREGLVFLHCGHENDQDGKHRRRDQWAWRAAVLSQEGTSATLFRHSCLSICCAAESWAWAPSRISTSPASSLKSAGGFVAGLS